MSQRYSPLTIPFSLLILFPLSAGAQITIGQAEMPNASTVIQRVQAVPNPMLSYGATGADHLWDFSNLSAIGDRTTTYQSVSSTSFIYAIAFADLPFNGNRANHARPGVDIPFSNLLPTDNPYTFSHRSGSQYRTVGFGAEVSGIPLPVFFDQHDVIYELPLAYGNTSSSHSAWHVDVPQVGSYAFSQDRTNEVDGWGVITTPAGTFEVLRVKTTLEASDELLGATINRPRVREYKWLAQGLQTPVLQINTTRLFGAEVVSEVYYYDEPRSIGIMDPLATTLCPGAEFTVHYLAHGAFNAGGFIISANHFQVQLSDASGSFSNAVTIGSTQATGTGTIQAVIPADTPEGTGYRIRVVSTSPAFTGTSNDFDITIGGGATAAISAASDTLICTGGEVILNAVGGPGYQWQLNGADIIGATGDTYPASEAGLYTATVSNACGTATSNSITVVVNDPPVFSLESEDLTICAGSTATLTAQDESGQSGLQLQWLLNQAPISGANTAQVEAGLAGQYTLEVHDPATGCTFTTNGVMVAVETIDAPMLTLLGEDTFCHGGEALLVVADAGAGLTYQWLHDGEPIEGATVTELTVSTGGTYSVIATSALGCEAGSESVSITVHALPEAPVTQADGPTIFCAGGEVMLSTEATGAGYHWYHNGTAMDHAGSLWVIAMESGTYTLRIEDDNGCLSAMSDPISVTVEALPEAPVILSDGALSFCAGSSVELSVAAVEGLSYQWWFNDQAIEGADGSSFLAASSGVYSVVASSGAGCSTASAPVVVSAYPLPEAPVITLHGDSLEATGNGTFQWFLDGEPIANATHYWWIPANDGHYTVALTDANGCTAVSEPWVHIGTGINTVKPATARAWPNPTSGRFNLEVPREGPLAYEVLNLVGQRVYTGTLAGQRTTIDLGGSGAGIYIIHFPGSSIQPVRVELLR